RIFPRRPNVSDRYHAGRNPGGAEMDAVLLRTVLSGRDFSRTLERRRSLASPRHPNRLAFLNVVYRAHDVAPRPAALPSRRRLDSYFLADSREITRHPWFTTFQAIVAVPSSSNPQLTETTSSSPFHSFISAVIGFGSSVFPFGRSNLTNSECVSFWMPCLCSQIQTLVARRLIETLRATASL